MLRFARYQPVRPNPHVAHQVGTLGGLCARPGVIHHGATPVTLLQEVEMHEHDEVSVEVSPFQAQGVLSGFLVSGRWPASTVEWARFLLLAVRVASVPGMLPTSTVFRVREERPESMHPGAVGLVLAEGPVVGANALLPGQFAAHQPPGLIVLHPPSEIRPSLPEQDEVAAGCVLLPGLPHLGLDHRAAWVEADRRGNVARMVSRAGIDPNEDADTAVLALLLAA